MARLNEDAAELAEGVKAVRSAAHDLVGEQLARGRERLQAHASSKTRKSAQTRERIMTAASEIMTERGNTNFQMSEVSERCHMSKGSLYYYFRDREELVAAIFDEYVDDLLNGMEELVATSVTAREALTTLYAEFTRRMRAGTPLSLALVYELPGDQHRGMPEVTSYFERAARVLAVQLERGKAEGFIREDVDAEAAATFALGGLIATSLSVVGKKTDDIDALAPEMLRMILQGIGVPGSEH